MDVCSAKGSAALLGLICIVCSCQSDEAATPATRAEDRGRTVADTTRSIATDSRSPESASEDVPQASALAPGTIDSGGASSPERLPRYITPEALQRHVEQLHPRVFQGGMAADSMIWFVADTEGEIVESGVAERKATPEFRGMVEERWPRATILYTVATVAPKDRRGNYISVRWATAAFPPGRD